MIAAQAEVQKAQADTMAAQNKQVEIQGNQQIAMAQIQLKDKELELDTQKFLRTGEEKFNVEAAKIDQGQQQIDLKAQQQQLDAMFKQQQQQQQELNDAFANFKMLREGYGIDAISTPATGPLIAGQEATIAGEQSESR